MGWTTNFSGWVEQATGVKYRGAFPTVQATAAFSHATSGTAPFFVSFSFIEDGIKENYFNREYRWDYDDPTSGNHTQSGESRNTDSTPVAGHVYETAGTYNPTVTLLDENGSILETQTVQIVIADPDVVYAGTLTICISQGGNFTGAPAGASQITAGSNDLRAEVQSYLATGKRILLRAGESWVTTTTLSNNVLTTFGMDNVTIGSYGVGALPIITGSDFISGRYNVFKLQNGYASHNSDIKILNLDVRATYFTNQSANDGWATVEFGGIVDNVLIFGCVIADGYVWVGNNEFAHISETPPLTPITKGWCFAQCSMTHSTVGASGIEYGLYVHGTDSALLDCELLHFGTHLIRTNWGKRLFYAHCEKRADGGTNHRDIYKIQSAHSQDAWFSSDPDYSKSVALCIQSNNWQLGDDQDYPLTGGRTDPTAVSYDQTTEYILWQGNYARTVGTTLVQGIGSFDFEKGVFRNNILDVTDWGGQGLDIFSYINSGNSINGNPLVGNFFAYNNTICEFGTVQDPTNLYVIARLDVIDRNVRISNNAWYMSTTQARLPSANRINTQSTPIYTTDDPAYDPSVTVIDNVKHTSNPFTTLVAQGTGFGDYLMTDSSLSGADVTTRQGKIRPITFG